jgi:act minimal PKS chain-length factor (CLF/KS beta)
MSDRTVFTGIGVVAPTGLGADAHWEAVLAGKSGLDRISRFDTDGYPVKVGGEVSDFAVGDHLSSRISVQTDHWTHMGLVAADLALSDAGVTPSEMDSYELAVITASSSGGTEFGQREIERLWSKGSDHVGVYQSVAWFYAATTGQISIRHGMRGPCGVVVSEQAGGLDAIAQARRALSEASRVVVTGGTDASLCPYGLVAQLSSGLLSTVDDPLRAFLPFDRNANGHVPGEGGAILIAERGESAQARGAEVYGELLGHAATFDPVPGSGRPPALKRAIEKALADARVAPQDIDVVFADAAGRPDADLAESAALAAVFGPHGVSVTAPKTLTGRLYGGGSSLDVATALLALRDGVIPPTVGVEDVDPRHRIDLVGDQPRELPLRRALVVARGYGGFNAAVVLGAVQKR